MAQYFLRGTRVVHHNCGPWVSEPIPMRKLPTGEPCAGEPHARFGGRGRRKPFPDPYQVCSSRISLDTRFRWYDGPRLPLFVLISGQLFSKKVTKNTKFDSISVETLRVFRALRGEGEVPQFRSHGEMTHAEP